VLTWNSPLTGPLTTIRRLLATVTQHLHLDLGLSVRLC
jgi:hypothetical protein